MKSLFAISFRESFLLSNLKLKNYEIAHYLRYLYFRSIDIILIYRCQYENYNLNYELFQIVIFYLHFELNLLGSDLFIVQSDSPLFCFLYNLFFIINIEL